MFNADGKMYLLHIKRCIIFGFISMHLLAVNKAHHCFSGSLKYFRMIVVVLMLVVVVMTYCRCCGDRSL